MRAQLTSRSRWPLAAGVLALGVFAFGLSLQGAPPAGKDVRAPQSPGVVNSSRAAEEVNYLRAGTQLPNNLPVLPMITVDYRKEAPAKASLKDSPLLGGPSATRASQIGGVASPGDPCEFDYLCNDCDPCTMDSCHDQICVGGQRPGYACDNDLDCRGFCELGVHDTEPCRDDRDCCGEVVGDADDGTCTFGVCTALGSDQCVNYSIPAGVYEPAGECDDGLECNGEETCTAGECVAGVDMCDASPETWCNEREDLCQAWCVSDAECEETPDDLKCTVDICDARTCSAGDSTKIGSLCASKASCDTRVCTAPPANVDNPCATDAACDSTVGADDGVCVGTGDGECNGGGTGECIRTPYCGPGTSIGGGASCSEPGSGSFNPSCSGGRCCDGAGVCSNEKSDACTTDSWLPTQQPCIATIPPNSGNINDCPIYGSGIAPQGDFTVTVGPVSLDTCDIESLGDDYAVAGLAPDSYFDLTFIRFVAGVPRGARFAVAFFTADGTFIDDIFFPDGTNAAASGPAIRSVEMDPPLTIPAVGRIAISVQENFGRTGALTFVATDAADVGTNDASILFVNGVDQSNYLGQCNGGSRDGLWCKQAAVPADPEYLLVGCPGGTCDHIPQVLAFELVGAVEPPGVPLGACCNADTGLCSQELRWECEANGDFFQLGKACRTCSTSFFVACNFDSECENICIGGGSPVDPPMGCVDHGDCADDGGTCQSGTCLNGPVACTTSACCNPDDGECAEVVGGHCSVTTTQPCTNGLECAEVSTECPTCVADEECIAACLEGWTAQGFGTSCDADAGFDAQKQHCCPMPPAGGDNCADILNSVEGIRTLYIPLPGDPAVTETFSGTNTGATYDDWTQRTCVLADGTGTIVFCDPDADCIRCPGGTCEFMCLAPTGSVGNVCVADADCDSTQGAGDGVCAATTATTTATTATSACLAPTENVGNVCTTGADCDSTEGAGDGVCAAAVCAGGTSAGEACDSVASDGTCTGLTCTAPTGNLGNLCTVNADCDTGRICTEPLANVGNPCTSDASCDSSEGADDGVCVGNGDGVCGSSPVCVGGFNDAVACNTEAADCGQGTCVATVCSGGENNGGACDPDVQCPSGTCNTGTSQCEGCDGECTDGDACNPDTDCLVTCTGRIGGGFGISAPNNESPTWWEGFRIVGDGSNNCADVRLDTCCTAIDTGEARPQPLRPGWGGLYTGCPMSGFYGDVGVEPPIGAGPDSQGFQRGEPFCPGDNLWQTFRLRAGDYYYPIYGSIEGTTGVPPGADYQFHVTIAACPSAVCCLPDPICTAGLVGSSCARDVDCDTAENEGDGWCSVGCEVTNQLDCDDSGGFWFGGRLLEGMDPVLDCNPPVCCNVSAGACGDFYLKCTGGSLVGFDCADKTDCGVGFCDVGACCLPNGKCETRGVAANSCDRSDPISCMDQDLCDSTDGTAFRGGVVDCALWEEIDRPPCPVCPIESDANCQPFSATPSGYTWWFVVESEIDGSALADDFVSVGSTINQFCWRAGLSPFGGLRPCTGDLPPADWTVNFYTDVNRLPGTLLANSPGRVFGDAIRRQRLPGETWIYEHSIIIDPPITVDPGGTYWVTFTGVGTEDCMPWVQASFSGNNYSLWEFDLDSGWSIEDRSIYQNDFAFCIDSGFEVPEPVVGGCCQCDGTCTNDMSFADCSGGYYLDDDAYYDGENIGEWYSGRECSVDFVCESRGSVAACPPGDFGPGESCATATEITDGQYRFSNRCVGSDGPTAYTRCNNDPEFPLGPIVHDIWFEYHASCKGRVSFDFCNTDFYTIGAVYTNGTSTCPTGCPAPSEDLLVAGQCIQNACAGQPNEQSIRTFADSPDICYLLRLAGEEPRNPGSGIVDFSEGAGILQIACEVTICEDSAPPTLAEYTQTDGTHGTTPRFIAFSAGDAGLSQAIRVRFGVQVCTEPENVVGRQCRTDSECETCVNGSRDGKLCESDGDCPGSTYTCSNYNTIECTVSDNCPEGETCTVENVGFCALGGSCVVMSDMPGPYGAWSLLEMWVGPATRYCENSGNGKAESLIPPNYGCDAAPGLAERTYMASTLQCTPLYQDWNGHCDAVNTQCVEPSLTFGDPCDSNIDCLHGVCNADVDCPEGECNAVTAQCEQCPTGCLYGDTCSDGTDCPGGVCNTLTAQCEQCPPGCRNGDTCVAQCEDCLDTDGCTDGDTCDPDAGVNNAQCDSTPGAGNGVCSAVCIGGMRENVACTTSEQCRGDVYVYHEGIIPSTGPYATSPIIPTDYTVQVVATNCDLLDEETFSDPLVIRTSKWGDTVENTVWPYPPPEGIIQITDVLAILAKFQNLGTASISARVDLMGASAPKHIVDHAIDINDVLQALFAFQGVGYPSPVIVGPGIPIVPNPRPGFPCR